MTKDRKRTPIAIALTVSVLLVVAFGVTGFLGEINYHRYKEAYLGRLENARSRQDRQEVCRESPGAYLRFGGTDWIAILSSPTGAVRKDIAILHDSRGRWFESHQHLGEVLADLRRKREAFQRLSDKVGRVEAMRRFKEIYGEGHKFTAITSTNVDEVTAILVEQHAFEPILP